MITAHTKKFPSIVNRMIISCDIVVPDKGQDVHHMSALWDTGASCTCISDELARQWGMSPDNFQDACGMENQVAKYPVYTVQLSLGHFIIPYIQVLGLPMEGNEHNMIIGMDVMNKGDVAITNKNGHTVLTFRQPSLECIDYKSEVEDIKKYIKMHAIWKKQGNNLCPCGSKKQWNNCHGRSIYLQQPNKQENNN